MNKIVFFIFFINCFPSFINGQELVFVQGGTFTMGCSLADKTNIACLKGICCPVELPNRQISLSDFYIGKYEVTQAEWQTLMDLTTNNPSSSPDFLNCGSDCPKDNVSWLDVLVYCNRLSETKGYTPCYYTDANYTQIYGKNNTIWSFPNKNITIYWKKEANGYRLPTEAEWEYAARGGNKSTNKEFSGSDNIDNIAWYNDNSSGKPRPKGTKQANELGIFDMSGNASEWCFDTYTGTGSLGAYPNSNSACNPTSPDGLNTYISGSGSTRAYRGGYYFNFNYQCRVSYRSNELSNIRKSTFSFRICRSANGIVPCGMTGIDTSACRYKDSLQLWNWFAANNIPTKKWNVNWANGLALSNWTGIRLNANGCVSCVDLDGNSVECGGWGVGKGVGITSPFPTAICQLSELEILSLRGNQMKSKIPDSIQYLKKLIRFYVDSCNLQEPIPDAFWTLENLVDVSLNYNNFNTELSPKIGNLKKLRGFGISDSKMKGTIPKEISDCTALNYFYARNNQFSGTIPQEVTKLKLQSLVLYNNEIDSVSDMSKADFKNFGYTWWGNGGVEISGNKLTFNDIVPNMIFAQKGNGFVFNYAPQDSCGKYQSFAYKTGDNLTVDVGIDYGITSNTYQWYKGNDTLKSQTNRQLKINNLQLSDAGNYYCEIKNTIATALTLNRRLIKVSVINAIDTASCRYKDSLALVDLYKATNGDKWVSKSINGQTSPWVLNNPITTWYGVSLNANGCVKCLDLDGDTNFCDGFSPNPTGMGLSGLFPTSVCRLTELGRLHLRGNTGINGTIPDSIQYLKKLFAFYIDGCSINGPLPNGFKNLNSLLDFTAHNNPLMMELPTFLKNLKQVGAFEVGNAKLYGAIPTEIGQMDSLKNFRVCCNSLSGTVPAALANLFFNQLLIDNNNLDSLPPLNFKDYNWSWDPPKLLIHNNHFKYSLIFSLC